ncbi:hypothetical protein BKA62DRAFT_788305 [Auriculariales sp. MPI-PUGE-AT-0066]|nr:hypothetical protein BKA62DRAFT_788305 [Auriculariales sp. MPI-PUGE-AT-0066]
MTSRNEKIDPHRAPGPKQRDGAPGVDRTSDRPCAMYFGAPGARRDSAIAITPRTLPHPTARRRSNRVPREGDRSSRHLLELDLANLSSVKNAVDEFTSKEKHLNVLYNSGGVMATPINKLSADGFDLQFGTNELGHFYLTQLLMPTLLKTSAINPNDKPRIITTSAGMFQDVSTCQLRDIARPTRSTQAIAVAAVRAEQDSEHHPQPRARASIRGHDHRHFISPVHTQDTAHLAHLSWGPFAMARVSNTVGATREVSATLEDPTVGEKLWGNLEDLVKNVA